MTASHPWIHSSNMQTHIQSVRRATDFETLPSPAPTSLPFPRLPSPRSPDFAPGYRLTTHILPAAYPRHSYTEPHRYAETSSEILNDAPPDSAPRSVRQKWANEKNESLVGKRDRLYELRVGGHPQDGPEAGTGAGRDRGPALWNVVNRYARVNVGDDSDSKARDDRVGLTVLLCHPNGMHKETWEPTIRHLINISNGPTSRIRIDEFWSLEAVNTGDSGLINRGKFGDVFDWLDHTRDILNFVENYLPSGAYDPFAPAPPTLLASIPPSVAASRVQQGLVDRNLVGLGHSFGATTLANAACLRPTLFRQITLIDPVIVPEIDRVMTMNGLAALQRRQSWPSREEAGAALTKKAAYAEWDAEVLESFLTYALYESDVEGEGVRLKTDRFLEAVTFSDGYAMQETWKLLETLPESVMLRWIMAARPSLGNTQIMRNMVWRREANASNAIIDANHLIPQEKPYEVAKEVFAGWRILLEQSRGKTFVQQKL